MVLNEWMKSGCLPMQNGRLWPRIEKIFGTPQNFWTHKGKRKRRLNGKRKRRGKGQPCWPIHCFFLAQIGQWPEATAMTTKTRKEEEEGENGRHYEPKGPATFLCVVASSSPFDGLGPPFGHRITQFPFFG